VYTWASGDVYDGEASLAPQQVKRTPSIPEGPEPLSKTP